MQRKIHFLIFLLLSTGFALWSGAPLAEEPEETFVSDEALVVKNDFTVETLIEDIFVKGACKNIFNIQAIGDQKRGIGYFENGSDIIGINSGIIMATGDVENAPGPNKNGKESSDFNLSNNDRDLRKMTQERIHDATGLEFDFTPLDSIVTFRYVFASEEYCEFVDDIYNDVFGFFVSGPGIEDTFSLKSTNVALIPGTDDFVSINNVNHKRNQEYYRSNLGQEDSERCQINFSAQPLKDKIEYDGFTSVLTATLRLIPCETYHLRLVLADVGDGNYDSAVFLEAESFNIGGSLKLTAESTSQRDTILEGCPDGFFRVNRLNPEETSMPLSIGLRVGAASTAREGVDFANIPKSVTIPEGEVYTDVPIELLIDDQQEPVETIEIELDFPCACIADTARLFIQDPAPMQSGLQDYLICQGDTTVLQSAAAGGVPGYTYRWSTGEESSAIAVIATEDKETYSLSITDDCGRLLVDSLEVQLRKVPELTLGGGVKEVCQGESARFPIRFQGEAPFSFSYTIGDSITQTLENIDNNSYEIETDIPGRIEINSFSDTYCPGTVNGTAELRHYRLQALDYVTPISCAGGQDGSIEMQVVGGTAPYHFDWDGKAPDTGIPSALSAGEYPLTITDSKGCFMETRIILREPSPLQAIAFDCREFSGDFISFSASGGTPPYLYALDGDGFRGLDLFNGLTPGQTYPLTIQDANGCQINQEFVMPAIYNEMVELPQDVKLELGDTYQLNPKLNIPQTLVQQIQWFPETGLSCTDCLMPELNALRPGKISVRIDDIFGCTGTASINIKLDRRAAIFVPTAFSPDGDGINDQLVIFGDVLQVEKILTFRVFNRWGALMYSLDDFFPNNEDLGWDGKHRGQNLRPDSYLYTLTALLTDGTEVSQTGQVVLIR